MSGRGSAWAAAGVPATVVAAVGAHVALSVPDASAGPAPLPALGWLVELGPVAFAAVGALLVLRRPRHPIGWLLSAYGLLLAAGWVSEAYAFRSMAGEPLPAAAVAGWLANWEWAPGVLVLGWALLLFPTGRLPSPRWRPLVWLGAVVMGCWLAVAWLLWPYRSPELASSAFLGGGQPGAGRRRRRAARHRGRRRLRRLRRVGAATASSARASWASRRRWRSRCCATGCTRSTG